MIDYVFTSIIQIERSQNKYDPLEGLQMFVIAWAERKILFLSSSYPYFPHVRKVDNFQHTAGGQRIY